MTSGRRSKALRAGGGKGKGGRASRHHESQGDLPERPKHPIRVKTVYLHTCGKCKHQWESRYRLLYSCINCGAPILGGFEAVDLDIVAMQQDAGMRGPNDGPR